ncbi:MAG: hypothetical protein UV53_C0009G0008 [Candidatus Azambacteria bacterium GW2011_GWE1_42_9]|nr:MAG: hypothetical protein UU33_C0001G0462 [Candidatus Azambacteria bacterium GW2011_GWF1_41_10]KKS49496.1 MAG: hypothetical protein UV14_C0001G0242 [Candidatus Azambacteria bacterium GW2011_GWF2_42_22]KKS69277.1 MAG: hypothetical protein UV39_C0015G0002 [Candidatus Azambacteria bacterium GW2011_GWA2_42_62]KKS74111.1 MAG: hypothetical protein UV45_C0012G0007 [Candidatus Azambacteria bacterium GW2011_GWB1_42_72]KKS79319.1 MAG: hypothetical protein UV53_C0009G0008 [Candidatus Azambacteria bacte
MRYARKSIGGSNPPASVFTMNEINWKIEEPNFTPKTVEWFWALGIMAFALVVFAILLKNYLFIVIVALTALIIYNNNRREPEIINFHLNDDGLYVGNKFYAHDTFESFWIFPAGKSEFVLRYKKHFAPLLTIPFHDRDESAIRQILSNHLRENEEQESFIDVLRKRFF